MIEPLRRRRRKVGRTEKPYLEGAVRKAVNVNGSEFKIKKIKVISKC